MRGVLFALLADKRLSGDARAGSNRGCFMIRYRAFVQLSKPIIYNAVENQVDAVHGRIIFYAVRQV